MYEEDKTLNFTTQNSILHYGVKGMKWGVINEDPNDPRNLRGTKPYTNPAVRGMAKDMQKPAPGLKGKAIRGLNTVRKKAQNAATTAKILKAQYDDYMEPAVDAAVQAKTAKNRNPEQQAKIDKMNSVSDETRASVQKVTSGINEVEKYLNAYQEGMNAWMDNESRVSRKGNVNSYDGTGVEKQQKKFAEKFMDKYGDKIKAALDKYNSGISELTNAGIEGFENNTMALNGGKPIEALNNLSEQISKNKDQVSKKSKNVVYGDYK